MVRVAGAGEPRVDVLLTRGDPLAAIDALAEATGRLIVVERRGRRAEAVELTLESAPWEEALAVLAKTGRCRLERVVVGGRRAVRVVQQERGGPRGPGAFLRPGQLWPLAAGRGLGRAERLGGAGAIGVDADDPSAGPSRGQLGVVYVQHDEVSLGVLVGPAGRLEELRLPCGAQRRALLAELSAAREGDRMRLVVSRFKGRWQVDSVIGASPRG